MSDLSSLLLGGAGGCPRGCSARGHFDSSRLSATSISTAMYWCAHCIISGNVAGGHSITALRLSWCGGQGGCVGIRGLAQWRLRLELGLPRHRGFYSNDCKAFVPEALILLIAYHTATPYHAVCGPCGEARAILPTTGGCRPCPSYPC
ncbi:hypothetical protein BHM03_00055306 [Ensete ventricosum]|nr:hypothetical protein BHM03_00055306 [Ensete ventricosum]